MIRHECANCGAMLQSDDDLAGRQSACWRCHRAVSVPRRFSGRGPVIVGICGSVGSVLVVLIAILMARSRNAEPAAGSARPPGPPAAAVAAAGTDPSPGASPAATASAPAPAPRTAAVGVGPPRPASSAPAAPAPIVKARQLKGHTAAVTCAAFTANGERLISGSTDGQLRLWDVVRGKEIRRLDGGVGAVGGVAFLPDDKHVLCAGDTGLRQWDVDTGKRGGQFPAAGGPFTALALTRDGRYALTCGGKVVRVWRVADGRELRQFVHLGSVVAVAVSADGRWAVSGGADAGIRLWDIPAGREVTYHRAPGFASYDSLALTADGRMCVFCARSVPSAGVWKTRKRGGYWLGRRPSFVTFRPGVAKVALSPDGRHILTTGTDDRLGVWDTLRARQLYEFAARAGGVNVVCFSPRGELALSGGQDGIIRLWPMPKEIAGIGPWGKPSVAVSLSPTGGPVIASARALPARTGGGPSDRLGGLGSLSSPNSAVRILASLRETARKPMTVNEIASVLAAMSELRAASLGRTSSGRTSSGMDGLIQKLEGSPQARAILAKYGLSARDVIERTFLILTVALVLDNGGPAGMEAKLALAAGSRSGNTERMRLVTSMVTLCRTIPAQTYDSVRTMKTRISGAFNK